MKTVNQGKKMCTSKDSLAGSVRHMFDHEAQQPL